LHELGNEMLGQQEDMFIIERPLMVKPAYLERLLDVPTRTSARLVGHSTVASDVLASGHKVQVRTVLDPNTAAAGRAISERRCTSYIPLCEDGPSPRIARYPTNGSK
jgi:hypothetical protein